MSTRQGELMCDFRFRLVVMPITKQSANEACSMRGLPDCTHWGPSRGLLDDDLRGTIFQRRDGELGPMNSCPRSIEQSLSGREKKKGRSQRKEKAKDVR